MDADRPPLVQADILADQAEHFAGRRAFEQAKKAHVAAAEQYQRAANATSDVGTAKVLLMQRDKQMKLSMDVQRQATSANKLSVATRQGRSGPMSYDSRPVERDPAYRQQSTQPRRTSNGNITSSFATEPTSALAQRIMQGNRVSPAYIPRERVEASMMAASNYTRRSSSPSESVMTSTMPPGGYSRNSGVEESYYLMRNADDTENDPMLAFLATIDGMVEKLGHAIAFASAPVGSATAPPTSAPQTAGPSRRRVALDAHAAFQHDAAVQESFYMIPLPATKELVTAKNAVTAPSEPDRTMINSKTREELLHENASLKCNLDDLTRKYHALSRDREHDRDTLRGSVAMLQKDLRRQAEKVMAQSSVTLAETRRQLPPPSAGQTIPLIPASDASALHAAQQRLAELGDELRAAKVEAEKSNIQAQRYKSRYDDLRKAIMDKRKAKDAAQAAVAAATAAAAAAAATVSDSQTPSNDAATGQTLPSIGKPAADNG